MKQHDDAMSGHWIVLATMVAATALLMLWPAAVTGLGNRCVMLAVLHIRCPFCGMTRDFALMLHGHAPLYNPSSRFALVAIYAVYPAFLAWTFFTKRLNIFHQPATYRALMVVIGIMWVANNLSR